MIITVCIINLSFAMTAKDIFSPVSMTTHEVMSSDHHTNDLECEIMCKAIMMSCATGIMNFRDSYISNTQSPLIKKFSLHTDTSLYSVDLQKDHKPPIFS